MPEASITFPFAVVRRVVGLARSHDLCKLLVTRSAWFQVMPLPDEQYEFCVKTENAALIDPENETAPAVDADAEGLLEDVAAISGEFHKDEAYPAFYTNYGEVLGGFPAIWHLTARAGRAFHKQLAGVNWEMYDWIATVDAYIAALFDEADRRGAAIFSDELFARLAAQALTKQ